MVRNLLGALLALIGAAAVVWSPFRSWQSGRQGRAYRLQDLFTSSGVSGVHPTLFTSLFLPMLVAAALAVLALALRLRSVVVLAGLIALAFAVLWMVRLGQARGSLNVGGDGTLGEGLAYAVGGSLLLIISAAVLRGRRPRTPARGRGAHARTGGEDDDAGDGYGRDRYGDRDGYGDGYGDYDDYGPQDPHGWGRPEPYGQPEPHDQGDPYGQRGPYSPLGPYGPGQGRPGGNGNGGPYGGGSHAADEPPQSTPPYGTPRPTQNMPRPGPGRGRDDQP